MDCDSRQTHVTQLVNEIKHFAYSHIKHIRLQCQIQETA